MTDPSTPDHRGCDGGEPKRRKSTPEELDQLRALRAVLLRKCVRLREEAGTVMPLDFIEAAIKESAK